MLTLTWERAGGRASKHAPDLHLQPADGECAIGMQTGGNFSHPSDEPCDLPDRYQTATHSLLSRDTQCACWMQTIRVELWDGTGTNRHAGLIVAVKIDLCEIWQIRDVASPDASVQGRGGAIRIKTAKFDLLLMGL